MPGPRLLRPYAASFMQNSGQYQPLFGRGILKDNRFHGDETGKFYAYKSIEDFNNRMKRLDWPSFDPQVETFADPKDFCKNCLQIPGECTDEYECWKCIGHDSDEFRAVEYADNTQM